MGGGARAPSYCLIDLSCLRLFAHERAAAMR
jgi:hypothetical protein